MGNQMCLPSQIQEDREAAAEEEDQDLRHAIWKTHLFEELNEIEKNHKYLDDLLYETQQHNLELMKTEINNDINLFVLNNLLLCVQFYDNFESASLSAKAFKQDIENHVTEKLAPLADDGAIHGDRRVFLLHGFPHEIAKNYIYMDSIDKDKHHRSNILRFLNDDGFHNCESIMPLEFVMSWDNLEIYKEDEYEKLKEYEYSAAKGAVAINRFCMEEPSTVPEWKKKIPKGYVRLRCVDVPLSIKQGTARMANESRDEQEYDYSHLSDFNEGIDEVRTDSDVQSSEDDDEFYSSGSAMMRKLEMRLQAWSQPSYNANKPSIHQTEKFPQTMTTKLIAGDERRLPHNYPMLKNKKQPRQELAHSSTTRLPPHIPIRVSHVDDDVQDIEGMTNGGRRSSFVHDRMESQEFLSPPPSFKGQQRLLPAFDIQGKLTMQKTTTSGYESMSSAVSRGSSLTSEDIREKWRRTEIKKLWDFPSKRRKSKEPVPDQCFFEVLIQVESDDDEDSHNNSESNGDSALSNGNDYSTSGDDDDDDDDEAPPNLSREPKYDKRTYLDSVAFSSNFCSEFKQIGTQMGLSSITIEKATVVGATIRCSVIYPGGLQLQSSSTGTRNIPNSDSFRFLYTFTPSIQSKCTPQLPLSWLLQRTRNDDEKWPQSHQVESIQSLGSNMIPLGHRSINNTQYENLQQAFEWQVGYVQAENVLLNSFKSVHWRTLFFVSLLFRAFLAPLGPLGIGLEHFRNTLYHMCHQEFLSWNDEQPGLHLRSLIHKVYVALAHGSMQNFFLKDHNMLRSIPVQNTRMIQAHLKNIQDNMLIYLMYAFRHLKPMRTSFYAMPNLVKLYKIVTTRNEKDLLQWIMSTNAFGSDQVGFGSVHGTLRTKRMSKKRRRQNRRQYNMRQAQEADSGQVEGGRDDDSEIKYRQKLVNKYEEHKRWQKYQEQLRQDELKKQAKLQDKTSVTTKKSSTYDLQTGPVRSYSGVRRSLLLKFFIEHFIHMAEKSQQFSAFPQAAMYILHAENLCEILSSINTASLDAYELKNQVFQLREGLGVDHMREYIKSKNAKFNLLDETMDPLSSLSTVPLRPHSHSSNIIFASGLGKSSRELPEPPQLSGNARPRMEVPRKTKTMSAPNFVQSLRSLPTSGTNFTIDDVSYDLNLLADTPLIPRVKDPSSKHLSIKYIDKPLVDRRTSNSSSVVESTDL